MITDEDPFRGLLFYQFSLTQRGGGVSTRSNALTPNIAELISLVLHSFLTREGVSVRRTRHIADKKPAKPHSLYVF